MLGAIGALDARWIRTLDSVTPLTLTNLTGVPTAAVTAPSVQRLTFDAFVPELATPSAVTYTRLGRLEGDPKITPQARPLVDINVDSLGRSRFEAVYTPAEIARAYRFDRVTNTGRGQTIAIPTAYHSPNLVSDVQVFDKAFNLPAIQLQVVNAQGGKPGGEVNEGWSVETALDVQWAHAVAPEAKILVVEAASASLGDLTAAVDYARNRPDVSVISMSWGTEEFAQQLRFDRVLTTPPGHRGITFVAASGDSGAQTLWPAISPNVLSVGGTSLAVSDTGAYAAEIAWSGSGGGVSIYEPQPAYQKGVQNTGRRTTPDVSYNAAPQTGYAVYRGEWQTVGGTSAAAPQWAGLIALANQARSERGLGPLEQAQRLVYSLPANDFHDIRLGSNGYLANIGYDLVTGRGSPLADRVIRDLTRPQLPTPEKIATTTPRYIFVGGMLFPVAGS